MTSFSQDIGGINYSVVAKNKFSGTFRQFKKDVKESSAEWRRLKSQLRGSKAAFRDANTAFKQSATAARSASSASKTLNSSLDVRGDALRRVRNETRKQAVAQRAADISARQQFNNEKRLSTATERTAKAHKEVSRILEKRQRAQNVLSAAQSRNVKLTEKELRSLGVLDKKKKQVTNTERLQAQAARKLAEARERLSNTNLRALNAEAQAARIRSNFLQKEAVAQELKRRGLNADGSIIQPGEKASLRERIQGFLGLERAQKKTARTTKDLLFSFRRLFGVLAAFTIARKITQLIGSLISQSILFNAQIETATLGVASLLTAVGQVRDANGQLVADSRALALAQAEARRQVQLLRSDALKTTATFNELLDTFQIAIAPGFQAGLDIDEIRSLTVRISQAASAIGLPQNQLAEEIRSLLSGTIQARTTRIAVALGITNEDIRNAREAGQLADFLQDKFAAFAQSGEEALSTFNGVLNRLRDGIALLVGTGGLEFFESVKSLLVDTLDFVTKSDPLTGLIEPNPAAVLLLQKVGSLLAEVVDGASRIASGLNFNKLVASAALFSSVLSVIVTLFSGFVEGAILGLTDVGNAIAVVANGLAGIKPGGGTIFNVENIRKTVRLVARILAILFAIKALLLVINLLQAIGTGLTALGNGIMAAGTIIIGALVFAWKLVTGAISLATVASTAFNITLAGIPFLVGLAVALFVAMGVALVFAVNHIRDFIGNLLGIELRFITLARIVRVTLIYAFTQFFLFVAKGFLKVVVLNRIAFFQMRDFILSSASKIVETLLGLLSIVSDTAAKEQQKLIAQRKNDELARDTQIAQEKELLKVLDQKIEAARTLASVNFFQGVKTEIENNEDNPTLAELGERLANVVGEGVGEFFSGIVPDIDTGLDQAGEDAEKLSSVLEGLPGIIANSRKPLEANTALMKGLRTEAERAADSLRVGLGTLGLSGGASDVQEKLLSAEVSAFRKSADLRRQSLTFQRDILGAQTNIIRNQEKINRLGEEDQKRVSDGIEASRQVLDIQRQISDAERSVALAVNEYQRANREGNKEAIDASEANLRAAKEILGSLGDSLQLRLEEADAILKGVDNQKELITLITETLKLEGVLVGLEEGLNDSLEDRARLLRQINSARNDEVSLIARRNAAELEGESASLRNDLRKRLAESNVRGKPSGESALLVAEAEVRFARERIRLAENDRSSQEASLLASLQRLESEQRLLVTEQSRSQNADDLLEIEAQIAKNSNATRSIEEQRLALAERNTLQRGLENVELAESLRIAGEARERLERPIETGFIEGLRSFVEDTPSLFESVSEGVGNALRSIGAEASRAIIDVVDPTKDVDFTNKVGRFFLNIAQQFIGQIINALIAQLIFASGILSQSTNPGAIALLTAAFQLQVAGTGIASASIPLNAAAETLFAAAVLLSASGFGGFRFGGPVAGLRQGGVAGFANAKGYRGGKVPNKPTPRKLIPRGLNPRDTVAAFLDPREFVVRAEGVAKATTQALSVINSGNFSPAALHAALGIGPSPASVAGPVIGLREGSGSSTTTIPSSSGDSPGALGVLVATPDVARRILEGGRNVLREFIAEDWEIIEAKKGA